VLLQKSGETECAKAYHCGANFQHDPGPHTLDGDSDSRFLELADIALRTKKPGVKKKKVASASAHQTSKTEPYSSLKYKQEKEG
jgi:hypothetical protein